MTSDTVQIRRVLISVSDKSGVVAFAKGLSETGAEILSTGGTAKLLADNQIPVTQVSDYTGFPEMMDGRVKTLHPKIYGGILGRRGTDDSVMRAQEIKPIDMVVVNLYPFNQTVARPECDLADAIENIDIGGPAMVRAAAKNHSHVTVVVDSADYQGLLKQVKAHGGISYSRRFELAVSAFAHTAQYDGAIVNYLGKIAHDGTSKEFSDSFNIQLKLNQTLRYGENPHQKAAFYVDLDCNKSCIANTRQIQGKELSFNNIADTDAALECVRQFEQPACVIVKHANPCGVATADNLLIAYERAYSTDSESAFGGIIAFNRDLDAITAKEILERQFVEVIIAPHVENSAKDAMTTKENVRLLECGELGAAGQTYADFKRVVGGVLVQDADTQLFNDLKVVTKRKPNEQEMDDLLFAWQVAKFVKSNAIVYAKDCMTIGIGAGQMSRVNSARIAGFKAEHAGLDVAGSVMASDAFFPFRDAIDTAAEAGISAIIEPGGSMRDDEIIAAANEHGIAIVFSGMRHFRH